MSSMFGQNHTSQWQKALLWLGKGSPCHLPPPSRWKSDQPSKMSGSPGPLLGGEERTDLLARLHPGDQALWMNVSLRGLVRPQGNIYTKVLPKQKYQTNIENEQNRSVAIRNNGVHFLFSANECTFWQSLKRKVVKITEICSKRMRGKWII